MLFRLYRFRGVASHLDIQNRGFIHHIQTLYPNFIGLDIHHFKDGQPEGIGLNWRMGAENPDLSISNGRLDPLELIGKFGAFMKHKLPALFCYLGAFRTR